MAMWVPVLSLYHPLWPFLSSKIKALKFLAPPSSCRMEIDYLLRPASPLTVQQQPPTNNVINMVKCLWRVPVESNSLSHPSPARFNISKRLPTLPMCSDRCLAVLNVSSILSKLETSGWGWWICRQLIFQETQAQGELEEVVNASQCCFSILSLRPVCFWVNRCSVH